MLLKLTNLLDFFIRGMFASFLLSQYVSTYIVKKGEGFENKSQGALTKSVCKSVSHQNPIIL